MKKLSLIHIFVSCFMLLSVIFLVHYAIVGKAVYGDGTYYWEYIRSIWKDHYLNVRNNWFPIGSSIAWAPAFILADIIAKGDGYSHIHQIIVGLENVTFVSIGITLLYRLLLNYFSPLISLLTVGITLFGTNLLFYGAVDVINSHPAAFLASTLFLSQWIKTRKKRTDFQWVLLGILLAFMAMIRTQDILFGLLLVFDVKKIRSVFLSAFAFFVTFIPQLMMWKYVFGNYFVSPYLRGGFNFLHPHIFEVLFSRQNGLIIWTPIYALYFFGLFFLKKSYRIRFLFFFISILQLYLITAWSGWYQGQAFSIRMMITGLPYLSFGLGALLIILKERLNHYLFYFLCVSFILYNLGSILVFLL